MVSALILKWERHMNYAEIKNNDIANGPGVRVSLFVSGCLHHCEDCFNEIAWDFTYGKEFTKEVQERIFSALDYPRIKGLSLLGGEPFEVKNQRGLLPFMREFKKRFPDKDVWCYSGFTYEELTGKKESRAYCEVTSELLSYIDVLVDGKFEKDKKNIMLRFRGSENQRLIDLNATRKKGEIVLWEYDEPTYR